MNETLIQEWTLSLSDEERVLLVNVLEQALKEALIEEHRTDAFEYSEYLRRKVTVFQNLIQKLHHL